MLLSGLLAPIPRSILEPELDEEKMHWNLEQLTAGKLPWVRISFRHAGPYGIPLGLAYDFLSNGVLVRREDHYSDLLTSWEDGQTFGGKPVPRHFSVQGEGLPGPMVTADVSLAAAGPADEIAQLPCAAADPGRTLRPIEGEETDISGAPQIHFEIPRAVQGERYPSRVETHVIAVIDRQGMPREIEVSAVDSIGEPASREEMTVVTDAARLMVVSVLKGRWRPALADGKPCEVYFSLSVFGHKD
jgi:hypothetical protein